MYQCALYFGEVQSQELNGWDAVVQAIFRNKLKFLIVKNLLEYITYYFVDKLFKGEQVVSTCTSQLYNFQDMQILSRFRKHLQSP